MPCSDRRFPCRPEHQLLDPLPWPSLWPQGPSHLVDTSALSRLSGVRQPSISQFLSGKVELSDDQLDRLLSCMGYRLEVTRRPVVPELTRSERRSWRLHCRLSIR